MIARLVGLLKADRGEIGRHVLVLGGGIVLHPRSISTEELLAEGVRRWAADSGLTVRPDDPPPVEAFAEAARLLAPDLHVVAVEDVGFAAPLKFYRDEPRKITVQAVLSPDGDGLVAHARLSAQRTLAGQSQPQRTVHFTGTVRLARKAAAAETVTPFGATLATCAFMRSSIFTGS